MYFNKEGLLTAEHEILLAAVMDRPAFSALDEYAGYIDGVVDVVEALLKKGEKS